MLLRSAQVDKLGSELPNDRIYNRIFQEPLAGLFFRVEAIRGAASDRRAPQ